VADLVLAFNFLDPLSAHAAFDFITPILPITPSPTNTPIHRGGLRVLSFCHFIILSVSAPPDLKKGKRREKKRGQSQVMTQAAYGKSSNVLAQNLQPQYPKYSKYLKYPSHSSQGCGTHPLVTNEHKIVSVGNPCSADLRARGQRGNAAERARSVPSARDSAARPHCLSRKSNQNPTVSPPKMGGSVKIQNLESKIQNRKTVPKLCHSCAKKIFGSDAIRSRASVGMAVRWAIRTIRTSFPFPPSRPTLFLN
jgi:hypothetical protein